MRFAVVCLFAVGVVAYVYARPQDDMQDHYTNKYDNIDIDQILNNDRLLKRYTDCLLEKANGKCPPEAIELKKVLAEALETECKKCSPKQKEMIEKAIKHLIENKKNVWDELKAKYDPDGKFAKKYEEMAKQKNVQI